MTSDLSGVSGWNCFVTCKSYNITEKSDAEKNPKQTPLFAR